MADDTQDPGYSGEERVFTAGGEHYGIMYDVYRYVAVTMLSAGGEIYDLTQQVNQVSGVANNALNAANAAQQTANQGVSAAAAAQQTASNAYALQTMQQAANVVYAGPASGGSAAPAFRALVASDLPIVPITNGGTNAADAPTARSNLGAASRGANSDITSITGMTTPLAVSQGGTGAQALTAYGVVTANGSSALGSVVPGVAGTVLTSNGPGSYFSFQPIPNQPGRLINVQVITATGTVTPTAGATSWIIEAKGGGGAGSGTPATGTSAAAAGGAGAAGGYVKHRITSLAASYTAVIGAAGLGASGVAGGNGGNTTIAGLTASGGTGGAVASGSATVYTSGAQGGSATGGNIANVRGAPGGASFASSSAGLYMGGNGGQSEFGGGGAAAVAGQGYGSGGGGLFVGSSASAVTGLNGSPGLIVIYEFA
ncbi:hypothetical protein [Robbsia andropogonis]|uniref:hypothetical protein n=1 Tax=Robbsia andropogonis TaxID=28092 RepID=UPI000698DE62|nr:hypothetical protein [Robbsia andropogonis]